MSVWVNRETRLVVQGITGRDGSFHARQMLAYGTQVVAGVTPGRGGQTVEGRVPVFDTVAEAVAATGADTSVIYVPARFAVDAIYEAADAGIRLIVCITEGIPVLEMTRVVPYVRERGARLVGPNCPGLISPGECKVGIIPGQICRAGPVGVVSRSGTLTYEIIHQLSRAGIGQSTCIGIGGDPIIGTNFIDCLTAFEADPATRAIVLIGEIGGTDEQQAAAHVAQHVSKPVVGFIAGQTAPPGRRMGHAGAIISGSSGTAAEKMAALREAGIAVMHRPADVVALLAPMQHSPRCIMVHAQSGIERLQDLRGVTLAMSESSAFSHFLRRRLPLEGVQVVPYPGNIARFLDDLRYAQQAYVFSEPYLAKRAGADPRALMVSDLGFNPYTSVLFARRELIGRQPELARRMVRASVRGWERYLADPEETNRYIRSLNEAMELDVLAYGARALRPLVLDATARRRGVGTMSLARWRELEAQLIEAGQLKPARARVEEAFTTRFLPRAAKAAAPGR